MRLAIVASRFNEEHCEGLLAGARAALAELGVTRVVELRVPGAFEIPLAAQQLASSGDFDAIVCLGVLIRGETAHYEHISRAVTDGIMAVGLAARLPVAFGVLTCETDEQAAARSAPGPENKGREVAAAAVELARALASIGVPVAR